MHIRELLRKVYMGDMPGNLDELDFSGIGLKAKSLQIGKLFSKGGYLLNWVANSIVRKKSKQNMNFLGVDCCYVSPTEGTITSMAVALNTRIESGSVTIEIVKNGEKIPDVSLVLDVQTPISKADVFEIDLSPGDRARFVYSTSGDFAPEACNLVVSAIIELM